MEGDWGERAAGVRRMAEGGASGDREGDVRGVGGQQAGRPEDPGKLWNLPPPG